MGHNSPSPGSTSIAKNPRQAGAAGGRGAANKMAHTILNKLRTRKAGEAVERVQVLAVRRLWAFKKNKGRVNVLPVRHLPRHLPFLGQRPLPPGHLHIWYLHPCAGAGCYSDLRTPARETRGAHVHCGSWDRPHPGIAVRGRAPVAPHLCGSAPVAPLLPWESFAAPRSAAGELHKPRLCARAMAATKTMIGALAAVGFGGLGGAALFGPELPRHQPGSPGPASRHQPFFGGSGDPGIAPDGSDETCHGGDHCDAKTGSGDRASGGEEVPWSLGWLRLRFSSLFEFWLHVR